jgi:hypothetical protein
VNARKSVLAVLLNLLLLVSIVLTGCAPAATPTATLVPTAAPLPTAAPTLPAPTLPAPSLPDPAAKNSAQALENVAKIIYDALAAGQDLKPYINGVMTAFGVPPLGEADATLAGTRYSQGLPLLFIPQVAEMADAFNDGGFISLDSFIAAANDQGARQKGTTNPLSRDYLDQKFAAYAGKAQYGPGESLPAFVLALGKERANRFPPKNPDPLWGDSLLDPIQLTLLLYSVSYASAGPLSDHMPLTSVAVRQGGSGGPFMGKVQASLKMAGDPQKNVIGGFIEDQIKDKVEGQVQDFIEVPIGKKEAAQVSVCASLLLYGHKLKVTTAPKLIWHNDGTKPWSTRVDVTLTFQDDYWDNYAPIDRWLLENLGNCKLPRRGTVAGKPLEWSVSDGLSAHGNYDVTSAQTDDNGKGFGTWKAVAETTPKSQRTFQNQRDAVGAVIVRAGSLVPGWSGLERIVGVLKDTGNTGDSPLTVMFYVGNGYRVNAALSSAMGWTFISDVVCSLEQPFTIKVKQSSGYDMTFQFTPSSPQAGSINITAAREAGTGTYTVDGTDKEAPVIMMHYKLITVEQATTEWNGIPFVLGPLDTNECSKP